MFILLASVTKFKWAICGIAILDIIFTADDGLKLSNSSNSNISKYHLPSGKLLYRYSH